MDNQKITTCAECKTDLTGMVKFFYQKKETGDDALYLCVDCWEKYCSENFWDIGSGYPFP